MSDDLLGKDAAQLAELDRRYSAELARRLLLRLPAEGEVVEVCERVGERVAETPATEFQKDVLGYCYAIAVQVIWEFYGEIGAAEVPLEESLRLRDEMEREGDIQRFSGAGGDGADPEAVAWFERMRGATEEEETRGFLDWLTAGTANMRGFLELQIAADDPAGARRMRGR